MTRIFDWHAHFDNDWYDEDRELIMQDATQELLGIINPGTDLETSRLAKEYATQYHNIYAGLGFHPHDAKKMQSTDLQTFAEWAEHPKVVAIGEIGLDYYYDHSPREVQRRVFIEHIDLAKQLHLPIIVHDRDAHGDIMEIIKTEAKGVPGVFHCYSGSLEMAKELLKMGYYLSFGGSATFKNAHKLREVVRLVPLERILLETDSPYLAPEPYRGKRNIPNMVQVVLARVAQERGESTETLAQATNKNISDLFAKIKL